jgi:hypothetical protein
LPSPDALKVSQATGTIHVCYRIGDNITGRNSVTWFFYPMAKQRQTKIVQLLLSRHFFNNPVLGSLSLISLNSLFCSSSSSISRWFLSRGNGNEELDNTGSP